MPTKDELIKELMAKDEYKNLNNNDWDNKSKDRCIDIKKDHQLDWFEEFYPRKITLLQNRYNNYKPGPLGENNRDVILDKINRLKDKFITVIKEKELRDNAIVDRNPIGTTYYIDLDGGNDGAAGTSTGTAWKTIRKYLETTSRSPGDIAYVRANTDETPAYDIDCDEDGTIPSSISIIGCDATVNDPWSDGSDTLPLVDFNGSSVYNMYLNGVRNWDFSRIKLFDVDTRTTLAVAQIESCHSVTFSGCVFAYPNSPYASNYAIGAYVVYSFDIIFEGCTFEDCSAVTTDYGYGLYEIDASVSLNNCTFEDNDDFCIAAYYSKLNIEDSSFDAGSTTPAEEGIRARSCDLDIVNSTFGTNTALSTGDLVIVYNSTVHTHNCTFNDGNEWGTNAYNSKLTTDTQLQTKVGNITRNTDTLRDGGGTTSAFYLPNSLCSGSTPLSFGASDTFFKSEDGLKVWALSSQTTLTVYAKHNNVWSVYPTNQEFYVQTRYISSNSQWVYSDKSTEALVSGSWQTFTNTIAPSTNGWIYWNVYLKKYQAEKGIFLDTKAVLS